MKKRWYALIAVGVVLIGGFIFPITVSAASGGDAIAGLKEFYNLLLNLAQKGLEGYIEFLKAV